MAVPRFASLVLNLCIIFSSRGGYNHYTITSLAGVVTATSNVAYAKRSVDSGTRKRQEEETCASSATGEAGQCRQPSDTATPDYPISHPLYKSGDIIELFNTDSKDIQIVFPSIVKGREFDTKSGEYIYHVTKTTDGTDVENIPERFLHMYTPYAIGQEILCNIGEFRPARPIIVKCTVLGYTPAAKRGAMVLQGQYSVKVHETRANDEYTTTLPVWKLQRRYLAGGSL
mmetsp:Transcript_28287/g.59497  ORF Transcript_28287/g.59497 Transcript_28287/m.59497 type:complete len:229 (-) Transcript_28287:266-952(-)